MVSLNILYLYRNGPATPADLPAELDLADERDGVRTVPATDAGESVTPVHYLLEHDRTAVVERFLAANPSIDERHDPADLVELFGEDDPAWEAAIRETLDVAAREE